MPICANGHQNSATDWCEVCGVLLTAPAAGSRPASSATSSSSSPYSTPPSSPSPPGFGGEGEGGEHCPSCGTPREGAALFCEGCRYNFLTHAPTVVPPQPVPQPVPPPDYPPYQREDSQASRPSQVNRPAESVPDSSVTVGSGSGDFELEPPSRPARRSDTGGTRSGPTGSTSSGQSSSAAAGTGAGWVAVIAADRAYFTAMMARSGPDAGQLYFPAFSPEVELPLTGHQVTIGRRRHSTGEAPDIDLSRSPEDPGVSHHHAVLVQQPDGSWSVVDQDSTNGTTVNLAEESIRPYLPVPLAEGDRVHVGAWTTITLRRA
jgi:hypothetical protein